MQLNLSRLFSLALLFVAVFVVRWPNIAPAVEPEFKPPVYEIHLTGGPIKIDGKLDEPAWFAAPSVGEFHFPWHKSGQKERTVAKLLWDDENLYVGHICEDAHITARHKEHDGKIPEDDCFEVIFAPDPARPEVYFNLEWNVIGGYLDNHRPDGPTKPRAKVWDAEGVRIAGTLVGTANDDSDTDTLWQAEVAIPLANFAKYMPHTPPQPGEHWNLNLNRHGGQTNLQYSQWSPADTPAPNFHTPHRFGRAVFTAKQSPFANEDCAKGTKLVPFETKAEAVFKHLSPAFCWFHPRIAPLPGFGKDKQPAVIMTIQKHLAADDHYSGLYYLRTDDLGKTWTSPTEIPELAWQKGKNDETIAVCDVTPGWHAASGKLLAIGTKLRYSKQGAQLIDEPRSHECAYAAFDPRTNKWTAWNMLALPDTEGKFFLVAPGCVQWLVKDDGTLLIPVYFTGKGGTDYIATVLHCSFDGQTLKLLKQGDEIALTGGRGFAEPSLAYFKDKYYLTLRNDAAAYVTTSADGLRFQPVKKWTFDDGQDLGSYNTQAHWLVHRGGLFLAYTRRGANNDHIARNRAPLFVAQVDADKLQVVRKSEQVLLPERGVMLGNFGAAAITEGESWVTDAEFILGNKPHEKGADGTVWLGRVT